MSKELDELEWRVESAGYVPGTEEFARRLRAAKVSRCKELQGVSHCSECRAFLDCSLVKAHLRDYTIGRNPYGQSAG